MGRTGVPSALSVACPETLYETDHNDSAKATTIVHKAASTETGGT